MRNDFKKYSWTLWLVILAFIGGFIVTDAFRGSSGAKDDLIYIGNTTIKSAEYQKQLLSALRNYKVQLKENFNKQIINQFGIPEQVLQQLINKTIIFNEAKKLNIIASNKELKDKIIHQPYFQRDGNFIGIKEYELMLAHNQISVPEFENELKEQIIMEKFRNLVSSGLVTDMQNLKEQYKKEKDNAEVEYVLLRPEVIKEPIMVTDSEIENYFNDHKDEFKTPERRAGYILFLNNMEYRKDLSLTDKDLRDFYKQHMSDYMEQGKTKVSRILLKYVDANREEILKKAEVLQEGLTPENFAQKAKELSEDNKASAGGDYGYFAWQEFTPQEKTFINSLGQAEISTPIDTGKGFSILFISEKVESKQQEFEKVKSMIRISLEKETVDQKVENKINELYLKLRSESNFKEKAEKLGNKVIETGLVINGEGIKEVDDQGYITRALFQLKEKQVSAPIKLQSGMAIVQLLQVQRPEQETLDKAKQQVKDKIILAKKIQRLMIEGRTVTADVNKLANIDAVKKYVNEKGYIFETSPYRRENRLGGQPYKKGLDNIIFSLPVGSYSEPIDIGSAVAVVKVTSQKITGTSDFEKDKEKFLSEKLTEMQNNYFSSYISAKKESYNVQINKELYQKLKDYIISRFS